MKAQQGNTLDSLQRFNRPLLAIAVLLGLVAELIGALKWMVPEWAAAVLAVLFLLVWPLLAFATLVLSTIQAARVPALPSGFQLGLAVMSLLQFYYLAIQAQISSPW